MLPTAEKLSVVKFIQIAYHLLKVTLPDKLSSDQRYQQYIYQAVSSGIDSTELANKNRVIMHYARWLITANWIFRGYVATTKTSSTLVNLTNLILPV